MLVRVLRWVEEVYSDMFALRLVGPAFHLAYLELQQIVPQGTDYVPRQGNTEIRNNFTNTHPADNYRFRKHIEALEEGDWKEPLKKHTGGVLNYLETCRAIDPTKFNISCRMPIVKPGGDLEGKLHTWMLDAFEKGVQKAEAELRAHLASFERPIDDFNEHCDAVMDCLEHGVVPSTIYSIGRRVHPKPTTVLNCGFFFYLGGMKKLLQRAQNDSEPIKQRLLYEKRLNEWLGKAIEDWQILDKEKKL